MENNNNRLVFNKAIRLVLLIAISIIFTNQLNSAIIISKKDYIINGNFENGNDGSFYTDYINYTNNWLAPEGSFAVIKNPREIYYLMDSCFDHTTGHGLYMVLNGSKRYNDIVWRQTHKNLKKYNDYILTIYAQNVNYQRPAELRVFINNIPLDPPIKMTWETCKWDEWTFFWNSYDQDSAEIKIIDTNLELYGNDFGIDDISFKPICSLNAQKLKDTLICYGESAFINKKVLDGFPPFKFEWEPNPSLSALNIPNPIATPTVTTTYRVKIIDDVGCEIFDSVTVNVSPLPPSKISYNKKSTTICPCDSIILSAPAGNYRYMWSTGETTKDIVVKQAGIYALNVANQYGCNTNSFIEVNTLDVSSIIMLDTLAVNIGETVRFPLKIISNTNGIECGYTNYKTSLKFNKTLLHPTGKTPSGKVEGDYEIIEFENSLKNDTLEVLEFIAALGNSVCTDITIERFDWNCENFKVKKFDGKFCLKNVCKEKGDRLFEDTGKFYLEQNVPNPSSMKTEIKYGIIEEGISRIVIYDILGNQVDVLGEKYYTPGSYSVDVNTNVLGRGIYFYSLQSPSQSITKIMEITK